LGVGVASLLAVRLRNPYYWLGMTIPPALMLPLASILDVYEVVATGHLAPYPVVTVVPGLLIPLTMVSLLAASSRLARTS